MVGLEGLSVRAAHQLGFYRLRDQTLNAKAESVFF